MQAEAYMREHAGRPVRIVRPSTGTGPMTISSSRSVIPAISLGSSRREPVEGWGDGTSSVLHLLRRPGGLAARCLQKARPASLDSRLRQGISIRRSWRLSVPARTRPLPSRGSPMVPPGTRFAYSPSRERGKHRLPAARIPGRRREEDSFMVKRTRTGRSQGR